MNVVQLNTKKINQVEGLLKPSFFEGREIRNYKRVVRKLKLSNI